ncbi:PaaI family thioesterase [Butyrivibrio sp.]|uniref:PaaI family thioesterase n=1 Tax=Butyrivibrio sp. TaxID=28121 RepID=UPI001B2DC11E|nr:PaaI family thioesterase [Butyrivibrio sp.]MBE5838777.1 PaaI family thioesterase [Butyrivibrio sp.]MBO5621812.1 PaaI family thioesterase [Butyrivibrio sp.]MBP3818421.1 PaaI family thioesterase [Butyrivibrio sp.]MBQ6415477.1 PaaI family thioesterase [Butyrivibrio sp.]MBQ9303857.1 PaaI family thioesterase [Butyrivibrio sp.]
MRKARSEKENAMREKMIPELYENKYNSFIGFEIMELSSTYSKARIKCDSRLHNTYGSIHGGALLSFVDAMAGATASMSGYYATTVSANLNFLLPAINTEYIYCECMKLKTGKHILVFDIRVTDDNGNLLDSGEFSFFASKVPVLGDNLKF